MRRRTPTARAIAVGLIACGLLVTALTSTTTSQGAGRTLVALVLDRSGSLSDADLARSRDLASGILSALPAGSEVAVFSFDDQARLVQPRTASQDLVRRAVSSVRRSGRFTALHDALYDASRYLRQAPASHRAIVLFTDGHDENSTLTLEDGLRVAQEGSIPVFAIGMGKVQERVLRRVAKLTGGEYVPGQRAHASALATRILALAPPTPASAGAAQAREPGPTTRSPAPPGASGARSPAPSTAPATRSAGRGLLAALLWVVGVLGMAAVVFLFVMRRRTPRCPTCGRDLPDALSSCAFCAREERTGPALDTTLRTDLSPTVLERLNSTEEYLEKTVTLRERPVLTITKGPGAGELFEVNQSSSTSIGRARANDIILKDISISGQHCRIRPENGGLVLHDLKSTNGTFVNEKRVSRHPLADGDMVQIGETVLQFRNEHRRA